MIQSYFEEKKCRDDSKLKIYGRYPCVGGDHHNYQISDGPFTADPSEFSDIFCQSFYAMHHKIQ